MKKFKLEIILEVEDILEASDILLLESDIIDGFEITRMLQDEEDSICENFYIKDARFVSCKELK